MIMSNMRLYDYWKISVNEEYGQEVLPDAAAEPIGKVKLSIYPTSTGTQDNILYTFLFYWDNYLLYFWCYLLYDFI